MTARGGGPNKSDHRFKPGDKVEYGTSSPHGGDRLGEVNRECREYGQDGYLIQPLSGGPGEGCLPSVYPGRMVLPATMSRWSSDGRRYVRNYSELRPAGEPIGGAHPFGDPARYPAPPQPSETWDGSGIVTASHPARVVERMARERAVGSNSRCLWCAGSADIVSDAESQLCRDHLAEFDGVSVAQLDNADQAAWLDTV